MKKAECFINSKLVTAQIDERLYGSFIEHMGRAVYTGIYEPGHRTADEDGFRQDVITAVKDLNVPIVRYPGGNFVSGYNWKDGIGNKRDRPTRLDYAWLSIEDNSFGIDEFAKWVKKASTEGMIAVNLGTGSPLEAGQLIEYCNIKAGTLWSDKRRKNGYEKPHGFKLWCLGNEMDGPWQTCQLTAEEYGKKARETAKIMKWVDPEIELVVCGSSSKEMTTFPEWDLQVLDICYEYVDYISLHRYYKYEGNETDFLASYFDLDDFIHTIKSTADYLKAKHRSNRTINLSLDEWNVWDSENIGVERWKKAPRLSEEKYTLLDALVVGGLLCTIVNNADRVKIACLAQLVNTISPIHTEPNGDVLLHSTYYPYKQVSNYGMGQVLKSITQCDYIETNKYGKVPSIQTLITYDADIHELSVFILNMDLDEDIELRIEFSNFSMLCMVDFEALKGNDLFAFNTMEKPENVVPVKQRLNQGVSNIFTIVLSKCSWNMIRFEEVIV